MQFLKMRDSEFRLPQEMCPYNSPIAKIVVQCQARILEMGRDKRSEVIV